LKRDQQINGPRGFQAAMLEYDDRKEQKKNVDRSVI